MRRRKDKEKIDGKLRKVLFDYVDEIFYVFIVWLVYVFIILVLEVVVIFKCYVDELCDVKIWY